MYLLNQSLSLTKCAYVGIHHAKVANNLEIKNDILRHIRSKQYVFLRQKAVALHFIVPYHQLFTECVDATIFFALNLSHRKGHFFQHNDICLKRSAFLAHVEAIKGDLHPQHCSARSLRQVTLRIYFHQSLRLWVK